MVEGSGGEAWHLVYPMLREHVVLYFSQDEMFVFTGRALGLIKTALRITLHIPPEKLLHGQTGNSHGLRETKRNNPHKQQT